MEERINRKASGDPVDYVRDRPYVRELVETLQRKFPEGAVKDLVDFLKTTNFMVVKKVPV